MRLYHGDFRVIDGCDADLHHGGLEDADGAAPLNCAGTQLHHGLRISVCGLLPLLEGMVAGWQRQAAKYLMIYLRARL